MRWPFKLVDFRKDFWVACVLAAIAGVVLWLLGYLLSVVKPPIVDRQETYTDISSFLGVMLPLNLIGNLEICKKWLADWLARFRDKFVIRQARIPADGFAEYFTGLVDIALEPYVRVRDENDRLLLIWANRAGFVTAIFIMVLFITGIYPYLKPYAILTSWPLVAYFLLAVWNGLAWNREFTYVYEHMEASPVESTDDMPSDDQGEIDGIKEAIK